MTSQRKKTSATVADGADQGRKLRTRRMRRTPEQLIANLQQEIERLRVKAAAKEREKSPSMKAALLVLKRLDQALDSAAEEGETGLRHALADARRALGAYLEKQGVTLPKANLPKGPRPRE